MKRTLLFVCASCSSPRSPSPAAEHVSGDRSRPGTEGRRHRGAEGAGQVGDRRGKDTKVTGTSRSAPRSHRVPDDRDGDRGQGTEGKGDEEEIIYKAGSFSA